MLPSSNNANEPPPPNPILTAYEEWVARTPLVTRYVLTLQAVSYVFSWFINLHFALATIPQFVIFRFEMYRLILSPVVNTSILSCVFAFWSFSDHGKRLEQSMGSAAFGWSSLTIGLLTNCSFIVACSILSFTTGESGQGYMFLSSAGLWTIIFGIIALECVQAPRSTQRSFFFATVPVLYYPVALFVFFALLSGTFSLSYLLSLGVGYAYGFGYLNRFKLTPTKAKQWEDTILANFARRDGWITGQSATGSDAWQDAAAGASVPLFGSGGTTSSSGKSGEGGGSLFHRPTVATSSQASSFPASSGRTLGGSSSSSATTRRTANVAEETRAARLQALERKAQEMDVEA